MKKLSKWFLILNLLFTAYLFVGSIPLSGQFLEPLFEKVKQKTGVSLSCERLWVNMHSFRLIDFKMHSAQKQEALQAQSLKFHYSFLKMIKGDFANLTCLAERLIWQDRRGLLVGLEQLSISRLSASFSGKSSSENKFQGEGLVEMWGVKSDGQRSLIKELGTYLSVPTLILHQSQKMSLQFAADAVKLQVNGVEMSNPDYQFKGSGSYHWGEFLHFALQLSYQSEDLALEGVSNQPWSEIAFEVSGPIERPSLQLLEAKNAQFLIS